MSTRACVARVTGIPTAWEGVYVHQDGDPSHLGATIWRIVQKDFLNCGNRVTPVVAIRAFCDVYITGHPCGWSVFAEECYCHEPYFVIRDQLQSAAVRSDEPESMTSLEWFYLLDPRRLAMTVLHSCPFEGRESRVVAQVNLVGAEPHWGTLEASVSSSLTQPHDHS